ADTVTHNPKTLWDTIHPEDRQMAADDYLDFTEEMRPCKLIFRIILPDGDVKYIKVSLYPIAGEDNLNLIAGTAEDITTVKQNIFYMEKINARKNSTLEILAHDLKGPLGAIGMIASSIQQEPAIAGKDHILQSV